MDGHYSKNNTIRVGVKCMVFPDRREDKPHGGSRYFYGKIVDVFNQIITVEVIHSTWYDFKVHEQLFFPKFQVWPKRNEIKQLSLFE